MDLRKGDAYKARRTALAGATLGTCRRLLTADQKVLRHCEKTGKRNPNSPIEQRILATEDRISELQALGGPRDLFELQAELIKAVPPVARKAIYRVFDSLDMATWHEPCRVEDLEASSSKEHFV
jgi:hypothetical protein